MEASRRRFPLPTNSFFGGDKLIGVTRCAWMRSRGDEKKRERNESWLKKKAKTSGKNAILEDIRSQKITNKTEKYKEKEARLEKEEATSTQLMITGNELLAEATGKLKCC